MAAITDVLQKLKKVGDIREEKAATPSSALGLPNFEDELKRINAEIYERNVELTIRNRTFTILQKMYGIINTSTSVAETAEKIINAIVDELKFQKGFIALIDVQQKSIQSIATSLLTPEQQKTLDTYGQPFKKLNVSLFDQNNHCVQAVVENKTHMTNDLGDVLTPVLTQKQSDEVANFLAIETSIIYPIVFAGKPLGVMVLCLDKHIGFLSRAEREILKEIIEVVAIAIERSQLYSDLKSANEQLKQMDKLKDDFVSVASHELRTPMTAIKSYLWMAMNGKAGEINEKMKYYLDRAYNSTDRLIKLVNDMLNISRIESGRMKFEFKQVDLGKLVEDVIVEVKSRADELELNLQLQTSTILPVLADPDKIQEVLINLIGNSLKFTPKGGSITTTLQQTGDMVTVTVTDTGVGMTEEDVGKLFQKFGLMEGSYQTNQNASLGTGLGLYICKTIIETHQGKIWAESAGKGKGSSFNFTLKVFNDRDFKLFQEQLGGKGEVGMLHSGI